MLETSRQGCQACCGKAGGHPLGVQNDKGLLGGGGGGGLVSLFLLGGCFVLFFLLALFVKEHVLLRLVKKVCGAKVWLKMS